MYLKKIYIYIWSRQKLFFQYIFWAKSWFTELNQSVTCVTVSEGQSAIAPVCCPDQGLCQGCGGPTVKYEVCSVDKIEGAIHGGRHTSTFTLWEWLRPERSWKPHRLPVPGGVPTLHDLWHLPVSLPKPALLWWPLRSEDWPIQSGQLAGKWILCNSNLL